MAAILNVAVIDPGDNSAVEQNGGCEHHVHNGKGCQQISTENSEKKSVSPSTYSLNKKNVEVTEPPKTNSGVEQNECYETVFCLQDNQRYQQSNSENFEEEKERKVSPSASALSIMNEPNNMPTLEQDECYETVFCLQDNQCYQQTKLENLEEQNVLPSASSGIMNVEGTVSQNNSTVDDNEVYETLFFLHENQCYQQINMKNQERWNDPGIEIVRHQPHPLPEVSVVKVVHSSPSALILAVIMAVMMSFQCFFPVFVCIFPGLILAIMGYDLGSSEITKHSAKAINGVSICCSISALMCYLYTITYTTIIIFGLYAYLYNYHNDNNYYYYHSYTYYNNTYVYY